MPRFFSIEFIHVAHECFFHGVPGFMLGSKLIKWYTTISAQGDYNSHRGVIEVMIEFNYSSNSVKC